MKGTVHILTLCAAAALAGCSSGFFDRFCDEPGCEFSKVEWDNLSSLANLPPPPADPVNKYVGDSRAEALGHQLYFDNCFSGAVTDVDVFGRAMPFQGRAPIKQPSNIACSTCHDLQHGGTDPGAFPGNVSVGVGLYDVNAQSTINAAYYNLHYWNGRYDSLVWQIVSVGESTVSMGGNRVKTARLVNDLYHDSYSAIFTDWPLPDFGRSYADQAALQIDGKCITANGVAPPCPSWCVVDTSVTGETACWPRFPLDGKVGKKPGCQRGDTSEPFGDAYDCMTTDDQNAVIRVYVNYAKAIAAYEYTLVSRESSFDRWIRAGPGSTLISDSARRGARLFVSKAACLECHNTPLFSDNQFHNIGVPQVGIGVPSAADCNLTSTAEVKSTCYALGRYQGLTILKGQTLLSTTPTNRYNDNPSDLSHLKYYAVTPDPSMMGSWRTPGLRDVALTAPYMHNGVYRTLEDVIWHYNIGGTTAGVAPDQMAKQILPLGLSSDEMADLVAFLGTLTGDPLPCTTTAAPGTTCATGTVPPFPVGQGVCK